MGGNGNTGIDMSSGEGTGAGLLIGRSGFPVWGRARIRVPYSSISYKFMPGVLAHETGLLSQMRMIRVRKSSVSVIQYWQQKRGPEGDFRNWDAIRSWATGLHKIHGLPDSLRSSMVGVYSNCKS